MASHDETNIMAITAKYPNRVVIKTIVERGDGGMELVGERLEIGGWVKSSREVKKQEVSPATSDDHGAGEALSPKEENKAASYVEILRSRIPCLRTIIKVLTGRSGGASKYHRREKSEAALPKQPLPSFVLLQVSDGSCVATLQVASVMRIRDALTCATHAFFENYGFLNVQVPVITTTDAEGLGEKFQVTTLFRKAVKEEPITADVMEGVNLDAMKAVIKEKNIQVEQLKRSESNKETLFAALEDLRRTNELALQLEGREKKKPAPSLVIDKIDSEDFFSCQTYLTVSGRLHLESYACALGNVYSFGPRFLARKKESTKSVAEMWMVETEMAFSQLKDAMNCVDDYFKFLCAWIVENCERDVEFFSSQIDETIVDRLQSMISCSIEKISYTEAVKALEKVTENIFEIKLKWGVALTAEHLSYLADEIYKRPVIIYDYPKAVKPFYVRLNEDGNTVAAFDMVVPKIGTLITGSQNEECIDKLEERMEELGLPKEQYEWYLDLRRHGTVKHSGFSLGFDLMVLFTTGLADVKDATPFPRTLGRADN